MPKYGSKYRPIGFLILLVSLLGCYPEEQLIGPATLGLRFDTDSLLFDTLLADLPSPTRFVHLHNPNTNAIMIDDLYLSQRDRSSFRLRVKGQAVDHLSQFRILGRDSLLIAITPDLANGSQQAPYLLEDQLRVRSGRQEQALILNVWAQDARRYTDTLYIQQDTRWNNGAAVLVEVGLVVEAAAQLILGPGMRLYFNQGAVLRVKGALHAQGTHQDPIAMVPLRQDGAYADAAGLWQGLTFEANSQPSTLEHVRISGTEVAIRLGQATDQTQQTQPQLRLRYAQIFNASKGGILAYNSQIQAENTLIYHANNFLLLHYGGTYNYTHCTFVNLPYDFTSQAPSFRFYDYDPMDITQPLDINLRIRNSIFWGRLPEEFDLSTDNLALVVAGNVLRTQQTVFRPFNNNVLGGDNATPLFTDPFNQEYTLLEGVSAINLGLSISLGADLAGNLRDDQPDAGAFEYQP